MAQWLIFIKSQFQRFSFLILYTTRTAQLDHISLYELLFDLIKIWGWKSFYTKRARKPRKFLWRHLISSLHHNLCRFVDLPDLNYVPKTALSAGANKHKLELISSNEVSSSQIAFLIINALYVACSPKLEWMHALFGTFVH